MRLSIFLSLLGSCGAFTKPVQRSQTSTILFYSHTDYLSSLGSPEKSNGAVATPHRDMLVLDPPIHEEESVKSFSHAPLSYFAIDQLTPKGPRKNADVGEPHDATRPFASDGSTRAGSWWCADGGWPSLTQRATTEVFYVLSGHGCLTDMDHTRHYFGPGDTVVLPKGWSGRWDVLESIHKVWVVNDHPYIEERGDPIRALVTPYNTFASHNLTPQGIRADAMYGSSPSTASTTIYNVGPTQVGCWTCTPGSFPVVNRETTECFHVLEGVFFLTNQDGSGQKCQAGDTVLLPKGWSGSWDVIETVKKLWVVTD